MELLKVANGNLPRTPEQKEQMIREGAKYYGQFLIAMGFDYTQDENSKNTPHRYAKSFVEDLIAGSINQPPKITAFPNNGYTGLVCQTNISIRSLCSHHHREIVGVAHIAYVPGEGGKVIGLSKLNRITHFYAQRFQLQEALTKQIHDHISEVCKLNEGVAVMIEATHGCVKCRGVKDSSKMFTAEVSGHFKTNAIGTRDEFYRMIELSKQK